MADRKLSVNSDRIKLGKRTLEIVSYAFENPQLNQKQLAEHFGVHGTRISQIMHSDRVLAAFPVLARRKVKGMVPKAMRRLGQLMEQGDNLEVSRKVVEVVLNTEKVLEPAPNTTVNVFQNVEVSDLKRIVDESRIVDIPLSDVTIVSDMDNSLDNPTK